MGTGYVRQSAADIVAGNTVEAGPLNNEFNQLRDAFHETSGHSHDGTTGEGPKLDLTVSTTGVLGETQGGTGGIHKLNATTAPTANDDSGSGYAVGSIWIDVTNDRAYVAVDVSAAAAVWRVIGGSGSVIGTVTAAADKVPYYTSASAAATFDATSYGRSLLNVANEAAFKTLTNLTSGVNYNAFNVKLASISNVSFAADKGMYFTAPGTVAAYDLSSYMRTLSASASEAALKAAINLEIGTDVQAWDAGLDSLASLSGTGAFYYLSAANTWTAVTIDPSLDFTAGVLSVVSSELDAELAALATVTAAANKLPYFTGATTAAVTDFTAFARTLLDDSDASAMRTTLGLVIGTNVQAFDAQLASLAALSSVSNLESIANLADPNADRVLMWDDSAGGYVNATLAAGLEVSGTTIRALESFIIPISDELVAITTGTAKVTFRMPYAFTLTGVRANLNTASSSGTPTFDINENGTTILSTKLTIDANEKTSVTAAAAAVISDTSLADDAEITIDIDVAGTGAKGAKITLLGYRP